MDAVWNKGMEEGTAKQGERRQGHLTASSWGKRLCCTPQVGRNNLESGYLVSLPRQGKFIRIHFGTTGKLASADIETCK